MCVDVIVLGGGLSGLMGAQALQRAHLSTLVLEKDAQPGGRLATWKGKADYGAQYFITRTPEFSTIVEDWQKEGLVQEWTFRGKRGSLFPMMRDETSYYATGGMSQLVDRLAKSVFRINTNTEIDLIFRQDNRWVVRDTTGREFEGYALLITLPVPAALYLLRHSHISLSQSTMDNLKRLQYRKCLSAVVRVTGEFDFPEDTGAMQKPDADIAWIIDNREKGLTDQEQLLTVQCDWIYSNKVWADDDDTILANLHTKLVPFLTSGTFEMLKLKRWEHAITATTYPHEFLIASEDPMLMFAGDAFGGRGGVEGAVLSGLAAAERLAELTGQKAAQE